MLFSPDGRDVSEMRNSLLKFSISPVQQGGEDGVLATREATLDSPVEISFAGSIISLVFRLLFFLCLLNAGTFAFFGH